MNSASVRVALMVIGLLGMMAFVRVVAWPLARVQLPAAPDSTAVVQAPAAGQSVASDSITAIVNRDPFRIGRLPAITAYDPVRLAQPIAPPSPRPQLMLVGIVNGPDASAVVEGLPGVEGPRVVRVGDSVAGLVIKKIASDQVVIVGLDTTWVLKVREPWKD